MRAFVVLALFALVSAKQLKKTRPAVQNGWIVLFTKDVTVEVFHDEMSALYEQYRGSFQVEHLFDRNQGILGFHAHFSAGFALILKNSRWNSLIDIIERNVPVSLAQGQVEEQFPTSSWGVDRVDQEDLPLNETYYYDSLAGAGVKVFVLDTGIYLEHEDFGGRASFGRNFETIDPDERDYHGHGSHVAGIVAGTKFGVAKKVDVISVKCLSGDGAGWMSEVTRAIDWVLTQYRADPNKKYLVNLSVQSLFQGAAMDRAVSASVDEGVIYIVAAGNNEPRGRDACTSSPGKNPDAISVGATDVDDSYATWSNHGACVDIIAPGRAIVSVGGTGGRQPPHDPTGERTMSGTSQSSPHVVGAAAIKYAYQSYTPEEMREALKEDAVQDRVTELPNNTPNLLLNINPFAKKQQPIAHIDK